MCDPHVLGSIDPIIITAHKFISRMLLLVRKIKHDTLVQHFTQYLQQFENTDNRKRPIGARRFGIFPTY